MRFASVGSATAFALTGVFAFATVIAGVASPLAFACVLPLTGMLSLLIIGHGSQLADVIGIFRSGTSWRSAIGKIHEDQQ